jgi:DNA-directed RNA polymerase subunit RPC12/RpoP
MDICFSGFCYIDQVVRLFPGFLGGRQMFSFCPHCGQTIGGTEQVPGKMLVCRECGKPIGIVAAPKKVMVDQTEELIRQGSAVRCQVCNHLIEVKAGGILVSHYAPGQKKICPGSGKPVQRAAPSKAPAQGQDLGAMMARDVIKVILCKGNAEPTIEELTLEYLDKSDRVRLQIEALRDMLGASFRMKPYPLEHGKANFATWSSTAAFVVARKHQDGGYQPMSDADLNAVLDDIRKNRPVFTAS